MKTENQKALTSAIITSFVASVALFGVPQSAYAQDNGGGGGNSAPQNPSAPPQDPAVPPPGAPSQPGTPIPTGPAGGNGTPSTTPGVGTTGGAGVTPTVTAPAGTNRTQPAAAAPSSNANDPALTLRGSGNQKTAPVSSATRAGRTGYRVSSYGSASSQLLPSSIQPILARVADLHEKAQYRVRYAPSGARQSYRAAESALMSALSVANMNSGTGNRSGARSAADASVSSLQTAQDIRALRDAARSAAPARASILRKIAAYYATGSKEFFTGQVREALLEPKAQKIVIRNTEHVGDSIARVSSALLPAASQTTVADNPQPEPQMMPVPPQNVSANMPSFVPVSPSLYVDPGYGAQVISSNVILTNGYSSFNSNYPSFPVVTISPSFNNFGNFGNFGGPFLGGYFVP